jgi:hypothetical protein
MTHSGPICHCDRGVKSRKFYKLGVKYKNLSCFNTRKDQGTIFTKLGNGDCTQSIVDMFSM